MIDSGTARTTSAIPERLCTLEEVSSVLAPNGPISVRCTSSTPDFRQTGGRRRMAFITTPHLLPRLRKSQHQNAVSKRRQIVANYLSPASFNINFDIASTNGNFGAVFFGQYLDPVSEYTTPQDVVVKCPIASDLGRQLYNMEKHTNVKLNSNFSTDQRFPEYIGELLIPRDVPVIQGISRLGLVWRKIGTGETLEDFITTSRITQLASILRVSGNMRPVRRELAAGVLRELSLIVRDLQLCGIVHRDIKPENILVVPNDSGGTPLKAIDFGSSCDWKTPFKKGLRLATCDPVYMAPEKRLDLFKPAYRFDVYSIGLIVLRCALPNLTESKALSDFVSNGLAKCRFSFERVCSAILSGRLPCSEAVRQDIKALTSPQYNDLYAVLATMLTEDPNDRANVDDCLRSRLLQSAFV